MGFRHPFAVVLTQIISQVLMCLTLGHQLVVPFREIMEPLRGGTSLEEFNHLGVGLDAFSQNSFSVDFSLVS